ncbi:hypothetical protein [uncultured Cyclobacterium sp.]|uniref:hypothetical protein n=1 Tax=uncultured Cyclobacterium sp. TaxID=453820 RepID=UPI0030ED0C5E
MEGIIFSLGIGVVSGILSGLAASYLFLSLYLSKKRPKIVVSNFICKNKLDGETFYWFKIVNKTDTEVFDVRIEISMYKPVGDTNGRNLRGRDIKLKDDYLAFMAKSSVFDSHNLHAVRLRTPDDLETEWVDDSSFIRLSIIAKHSLSGLSSTFSHDFNSRDCITEKKFKSGDDLSVS